MRILSLSSPTFPPLQSAFSAPHLTIPSTLQSPFSILELACPISTRLHSFVSDDPPATRFTRKRRSSFVRGVQKRKRTTMQISERVPEDLLAPIFEQLQDQRDLYACSLVSRTFNRAVTPILYRSWDTRVIVDLPANDRFKRSHKVFLRLSWQ